MIVMYTPAGMEPRQYDAEELTCGEADAVGRATDLSWQQVRQALRSQEPGALRAVAWAWEKRQEPTLRFSHFDPPLKTLKARFSNDEIPEFLTMADQSGMNAAQRERIGHEVVMYAVDPDGARQAVADHNAPKEPVSLDEPAPSDSSGTSGNS